MWKRATRTQNTQVFYGSTQKTRTDHEKLKFAKSKGSSWPGTIPVNMHASTNTQVTETETETEMAPTTATDTDTEQTRTQTQAEAQAHMCACTCM